MKYGLASRFSYVDADVVAIWLDIIELIDGSDTFGICVIRTAPCSHEDPCSLHDKIAPMRHEERMLFATESIADLVSEFREGKDRISI